MAKKPFKGASSTKRLQELRRLFLVLFCLRWPREGVYTFKPRSFSAKKLLRFPLCLSKYIASLLACLFLRRYTSSACVQVFLWWPFFIDRSPSFPLLSRTRAPLHWRRSAELAVVELPKAVGVILRRATLPTFAETHLLRAAVRQEVYPRRPELKTRCTSLSLSLLYI